MNSHGFPADSCALKSAPRPTSRFSLQSIVDAFNAITCSAFFKSRRIGDELATGQNSRLGYLPHKNDSAQVSTSSFTSMGNADVDRRVTTIETLPDEVLLEIFDYHRLDALDYSLLDPWEWHRLAHVCHRWRSLIFSSPRRLDLRLVYTYRRPVGRTLECWPALPIALWYPRLVLWRPLASADEDNVISALNYSDRIREINLTMTSSLLEKLAALVQEPFPALEYLRMGSQELLGSVVLPDEFLGGHTPRLRQIDLSGTAFPTLPRLLLSTRDLVSLQLDDIPDAGYFSPEALATGLGATPQLKSLKVHFLSPTAHQDQESPCPSSLDRAVLPALIDIQFRGDCEYLEDLVARLSAPLLEKIEITFFDRLFFDIPQLSQFIDLTERLGSSPYLTSIWLWERGFSITHYFPHPSPRGTLRLQIPCLEFARRMASLTHINRQLFPLVSSVRRLEIEAHRPSVSPADEVNPVQWLELFGLFVNVRRLELTGTLVPSMAAALEQSMDGVGRQVFSALRDIHLRGTAMSRAVEEFIAARKLSGHVVSVHYAGEGFYDDWFGDQAYQES